MRLVSDCRPLHELYAPGSRKTHFPEANFRFLVRAATNIAIAVSKVHAAGAVIGDINHSGILISKRAMAVLIDADSFQFGTRHLCRVGVPEYTPPELQGVKLEGIIRSPQHDGFGLAVALFQLLFMGRHPFVGRYTNGEMPLERAVAEYRFAFSSRSDTGMTPPPGACRLTDYPNYIRQLFEAAFGRDLGRRPVASVWAEALRRLETTLTECPANPMHHYPSAAGACVWCRMERQIGIVLFLPPHGASAKSAAEGGERSTAGFNLQTIWADITAVQLPVGRAQNPLLPRLSLTPSTDTREHKLDPTTRWIVAILAFGAGIAVMVALPKALLLGLFLSGIAFTPFAWDFGSARDHAGRFKKADQAYATAVAEWRERIGLKALIDRRQVLEGKKKEYQRLEQEHGRRMGAISANRKAIQLKAYLEGFPIRRASIEGIGPTRTATLVSYGIDTAASIDANRLLNVPGFGQKNILPLLAWRHVLEARFVFRDQPTSAERQEKDRLKQEFTRASIQLRVELQRGAAELKAAATTVEERLKVIDLSLAKAFEEREQIRVDLEHLKFTVPAAVPIPYLEVPTSGRHNPHPASQSPGAQPRHAGTASVASLRCPNCGGGMLKRTARRGQNKGRSFWGCSHYPNCQGTRPI